MTEPKDSPSLTAMPIEDALDTARQWMVRTAADKFAAVAPTLNEDGISVSYTLTVAPQASQHPITNEVVVNSGALLNLWVGPTGEGEVVAVSKIIPYIYSLSVRGEVESFFTDCLAELEKGYASNREKFQ